MQLLKVLALASAITGAVALPLQDFTSADLSAMPVGDDRWRRRPAALFTWADDDPLKEKWQQEVDDDWHAVT
jgi:hypothetical protein